MTVHTDFLYGGINSIPVLLLISRVLYEYAFIQITRILHMTNFFYTNILVIDIHALRNSLFSFVIQSRQKRSNKFEIFKELKFSLWITIRLGVVYNSCVSKQYEGEISYFFEMGSVHFNPCKCYCKLLLLNIES